MKNLVTPREFGLRMGMSAKRVNLILRDAGLQWRDEHGDWRLTDEGARYGREFRHYEGATCSHYVRWHESVVSRIERQRACLTARTVLAGDGS